MNNEQMHQVVVRKIGEGMLKGIDMATGTDVSSTINFVERQKILHPEKNIVKKRGRLKEGDLTREDYKERYEILKKYQAFLKEQREKK